MASINHIQPSVASSRHHLKVVPIESSAMSLDLTALEERLFVAFTARLGPDLGREVTAEAMAWAWEHRTKLESMKNPAGYLFRVGQSKSRKFLRWSRERASFPTRPPNKPEPLD